MMLLAVCKDYRIIVIIYSVSVNPLYPLIKPKLSMSEFVAIMTEHCRDAGIDRASIQRLLATFADAAKDRRKVVEYATENYPKRPHQYSRNRDISFTPEQVRMFNQMIFD
jgi:hypothetical protein